jgi:predicted 3-demethylubiquinone-9 3-methyltransferase (glyoxalase superfamily)
VGPEKDMAGKILTAVFELDGIAFQALDGGPIFQKNPSVSFMVNFDPSRDEKAAERLEEMWKKLAEGGKVLMPLDAYPFSKKYGWIEDRFGVSWQLILTDPNGEPRPSIIPSLLFVKDVCGKAKEALNFYVGIFKNSKMGMVAPYPAGMEPDKEGTTMFGEACLDGEWIIAMDSAQMHNFSFNEAISLSVECADQAEVDYFWEKLREDGGMESECGWLKDKYGFSWQIIPKQLEAMFTDPDEKKSNRALKAMLNMQKINIAEVQRAYEGA